MMTYERARECFNYDPDTGLLTWLAKSSPSSNVQIGAAVGGRRENGYLRVVIDRKIYVVHRVIWLWMTGEWPADEIDHINRDRSDNRWVNLRAATRLQNRWNTGKSVVNTSGFKGVYFNTAARKWHARIRVNHRRINLGFFGTREEAHAAYVAAATKYFGDFARAA